MLIEGSIVTMLVAAKHEKMMKWEEERVVGMDTNDVVFIAVKTVTWDMSLRNPRNKNYR